MTSSISTKVSILSRPRMSILNYKRQLNDLKQFVKRRQNQRPVSRLFEKGEINK